MLTVKCIMMQRNDRALLEPWLRYHAYLFGIANLVVIDNGSTDEHVLSVLARYHQSGCAVVRDFDAPEDLARKAELIAEVIRVYDGTEDYDFALPLECDEFVCYFGRNQYRCDRDGLLAHLASLGAGAPALRVGITLDSVPGEPGWFELVHRPRPLLRRATLSHLDADFQATTIWAEPPEPTQLALARHRPRRDDAEPSTKPAVAFPELAAQLANLGIGLDGIRPGAPEGLGPFRGIAVRLPRDGDVPARILDVDADYYARANPDLGRSGQDALEHFVTAGFGEGRRFARPASSASGVRVRRAEQDDLQAIVRLLANDGLGATREVPTVDDRYLAAFAAIDADPNQALIVLDDAGAVVGCLQLTIIPGLSMHGGLRGQVEAVRIAASRRGQGLGHVMMEWAMAESRRRGCTLVQLTTNKVRTGARRFYRSLGFVESHEGMKLHLSE